MPSGYKLRDVPSRYQPLIDHLATQSGEAMTLTFTEIEALVGEPLPLSARVSTSYWTSRSFAHVRGWKHLGWRAHLDHVNRRVVFTRQEE